MKLKTSIILMFLTFLLIFSRDAEAQFFRSKYLWITTFPISGTPVDSTFSTRWESALIYSDTVTVLLRIGNPDTTSWSNRPWLYLDKGSALELGPSVPLIRLEVKTVAGTGNLYIVGYKRRSQF